MPGRLRRVVPAILLLSGAVSCTGTRVSTTHYLGVFDPQEQATTQELYKIEIAGAASWFHDVKYGTGWVPAEQADLLARSLRRDERAQVKQEDAAPPLPDPLAVRSERNFFEIGPLGISAEPQNGRFVVVMSSDPDLFFRRAGTLASLGKEPARKTAEREAAEKVLHEIRAARTAAEDERKRLRDAK